MKNLLLKVKAFFKSLGVKILEILAGKAPELPPTPQPDPPKPPAEIPAIPEVLEKPEVPEVELKIPKPRRSAKPIKGRPRRKKPQFPIRK